MTRPRFRKFRKPACRNGGTPVAPSGGVGELSISRQANRVASPFARERGGFELKQLTPPARTPHLDPLPFSKRRGGTKTAWNLIIDEHCRRLTSKLLFRLCKPGFPLDIQMIIFS